MPRRSHSVPVGEAEDKRRHHRCTSLRRSDDHVVQKIGLDHDIVIEYEDVVCLRVVEGVPYGNVVPPSEALYSSHSRLA